jgi:hypothetical protein
MILHVSGRPARQRSRITVADVVLVMIVAGGCLTGLVIQDFSPQAASYVISVRGKEVSSGPLTDVDTIEVEGTLGLTLVEVTSSGVAIIRSPCPLHLCESMGRISRSGATLVCVPNQVVVELRGGGDANPLDAIVR